ncbi:MULTISPECIES: hypothetical protein [Amycolatopsis]|uniref:Uncharacterized protein n=1 Tax=Amycolatopsis bullii TaxID=941987 RepID=A0ABQ3KFZ5_9PSEU|nr:hypothetical protein [Amycolatopsis bullii]GHG08919.1 hypothetical protein GCM10017567_27210 [Amycolatopsis bullii]
MDSDVVVTGPDNLSVGVLLAPSTLLSDSEQVDDDGYAPAMGARDAGKRVAEMGHKVLHAAAAAVGQEIGLVVRGVVAGIEQHGEKAIEAGSFGINDVVLKFGIKATIGAGKAVEALFTSTGEATVEVSLTLRKQ